MSQIEPLRGKSRGAQGFDPLKVRPRRWPLRGQPLTPREREVLERIASGDTTVIAARHLYLAHATVKHHLEIIKLKLGTHTAAHSVAQGIRTGQLPCGHTEPDVGHAGHD